MTGYQMIATIIYRRHKLGYRSDVRISLSKKAYKELKKYTNRHLKDDNWEYGNLLDKCDISYEDNDFKYIGWNNVKWYEFSDDYLDVCAIMNGLQHLKDLDFSYRYARIGESYDDYEEDSYDSNTKADVYLEYPYMIREFDDDYITRNMTKSIDNDMKGIINKT